MLRWQRVVDCSLFDYCRAGIGTSPPAGRAHAVCKRNIICSLWGSRALGPWVCGGWTRLEKPDFFQLTKTPRDAHALQTPRQRKMILTTCPACAAPLAHTAPRCVRCHLRYCNNRGRQRHAGRCPRGRDDTGGDGTDRSARARSLASDHIRDRGPIAKSSSSPQRPRDAAAGECVTTTIK